MASEYRQTERTRVYRKPGRASYDRDVVHSILDEALSCHVGFVQDGQPYVLQRFTRGWGRPSSCMGREATACSRRWGTAFPAA
jgi:hypothetical protein